VEVAARALHVEDVIQSILGDGAGAGRFYGAHPNAHLRVAERLVVQLTAQDELAPLGVERNV
jgi:hypothetical protein